MSHERTQIRNATIALISGHTSVGSRVGASRLAPQRGAILPAISVYVVDETIDGIYGNSLRREATVAIDGWVHTVRPEDLDEALDNLAFEIETAIDANPGLGLSCVFSPLWLQSTELGLKLETDRPQGCVHLEYSVIYETDPRVAAQTDDFLRVDSTTADPAPGSEDRFNVR